MRHRFCAIAFDFDGVLVESVDVKTRAFELLYSDYGDEVRRAVVEYHLAHGGISRIEKFRYFHRVILGRNLTSDEESRLSHMFSILVEDAVVAAPWVKGAKEFLDSFYSSQNLYVASGTPEVELRRIISRRGMHHYFRDARGTPSAKGALLMEFSEKQGIDTKQLLMVGDAMTDYEAACDVGCVFIGRVAAGRKSSFPSDVQIIPDLSHLAGFACG